MRITKYVGSWVRQINCCCPTPIRTAHVTNPEVNKTFLMKIESEKEKKTSIERHISVKNLYVGIMRGLCRYTSRFVLFFFDLKIIIIFCSCVRTSRVRRYVLPKRTPTRRQLAVNSVIRVLNATRKVVERVFFFFADDKSQYFVIQFCCFCSSDFVLVGSLKHKPTTVHPVFHRSQLARTYFVALSNRPTNENDWLTSLLSSPPGKCITLF